MQGILSGKGVVYFTRRLPQLNVANVVLLCAATVTVAMVLYPLVILVLSSFQIERLGQPTVFTLDNYARLFTNPRLLGALRTTLIMALGTSLLATFFGVSLAWITARTDSLWAQELEPLILMPFYLSPLVGAISWTYLASPNNGSVNVFLTWLLGLEKGPFNIYSLGGIIWVMGLFFTPYMYLFTIGSLRKMDPSLEESARISGCGLLGTTLRITLPLATPSVLFGFSLTLITGFGMFGVPAVLGIPANIDVLSTLIYETVALEIPNYNMAATYGMIMIALTLLTLVVQRKVISPRQFTTVTGKGYRPGIIKLGRWRCATFAFSLFYLAVAVVLPLLVLGMVSVSRYWDGTFDLSRITLNNYWWVLFNEPLTQRAIWNSLFLSTVTATFVILLGFLIAYIVYRTRVFGRGALDFIATFPAGVPGLVIAMGVLVAYISTPIYGTIWILMLAYATRFLPVGLKSVSGVLMSIGPELEQSARVCGASWMYTAWAINFPLMKSGLIAGWMLLLLIFMREFNTSILLFSPGTEVMSVAMYYMLENSPPVHLAAFAMIQTLIMLIMVVFVRKVAGPDTGTF